MQAAPAFNPIKYLRRAQALRDAHIAERAKALAPSLSSTEVAKRLGVSRLEIEQLAARHGFSFHKHDIR